MVDESHDCLTCGTHFVGNYCPRCGQSARVGRYSVRKAFMHFLDVWAMGNRSMVRSIRDLMLRPGYMIRDYLHGMQMAYFPPFKMFFLLLTLSVLVHSGLNIKGEDQIEFQQKVLSVNVKSQVDDTADDTKVTPKKTETKEEKNSEVSDEEKTLILNRFEQMANAVLSFLGTHRAIAMFGMMFLLSLPLYWLFRRSPAYPDINYAEFFVAMTYSENMMSIYFIVLSFLCVQYSSLTFIVMLTPILPLKQLFGYSTWKTVWRYLLSIAILFVLYMLTLIIVAAIITVLVLTEHAAG